MHTTISRRSFLNVSLSGGVLLPSSKHAVKRKKTDRASWIPVSLANGLAMPVEYHGSAHLNALSHADGLICIPIGVAELAEGTLVDVRQI